MLNGSHYLGIQSMNTKAVMMFLCPQLEKPCAPGGETTLLHDREERGHTGKNTVYFIP